MYHRFTTASFLIIVSGSPTNCFKSTRGLRQGDPLSPYLFVLGMEVFSILITKAASGGFLSGFNLKGRSGEEVEVAHLLFEDNTLVFCKDSREQLVYLSWILMWFIALSGLKINLSKCFTSHGECREPRESSTRAGMQRWFSSNYLLRVAFGCETQLHEGLGRG